MTEANLPPGVRARPDGLFEQGSSPEPSGNAGFWYSLTFKEIARAQGVKPVEKLEDLIPKWPEGE